MKEPNEDSLIRWVPVFMYKSIISYRWLQRQLLEIAGQENTCDEATD